MSPHSRRERSFDWSTRSDPAGRSTRTPDLLHSPSTSDYVLQEAQPKRRRGIEDLPTTPSLKFDNSSICQDSQIKGQKRKRACAGDQVGKQYNLNDWNNPTLIYTDNQLAVPKQDGHTKSVPGSEGSKIPEINHTIIDPIQYWAHNQEWPENFANMSQAQSASFKRRTSSHSYTQRRKGGEVPEAYSSAYETYLSENRMVMNEFDGHSRISQASKSLCAQLLSAVHQEPEHTMFPLSQFLPLLRRASNRNEARIARDITPLLVPSPELLYLSGHVELEHLVEEIGVEWSKCKTLGGPKPRPDLAVGLASSAFTEEEMAKLSNHASPERPTAFTDKLYFPFVVCEVKCADQGIRRAERQNMHSGSIAVNAIMKLQESLGPENMKALDGQVLVYSISHDNEQARLYGHLVYQETFYRYPVASSALSFDGDQGWKCTHDFFREVYHSVYPAHLKRIREALAAMPDPQKTAMTSNMSFEGSQESGPQELDPSAHSSQENASFKKPDMPASKMRKSEVALLRAQLADQQTQIKEQAEQHKEEIRLLTQLLQRQ